MEYQVQMAYTQEDVAALVKALEFRRRPEKNLRLAMKIGYPLFGILLILAGGGVLVAMATAGLFSILSAVISVLCLLGGVALLRRSDSRGMERRSWKKYPNKGLVLTYTFNKEDFREEDEVSGENVFPYLSIRSAHEDADHFFLFTASNAAHMLRKDSFVCGDPASVRDFIRNEGAVLGDPIE